MTTAPREMPGASPADTLAWRMLLPASVGHGPGTPRSLRDWVVDIALAAIAVGIGLLALSATAGEHSGVEMLIDVGLGIAAWAGLWVRRSHPFALALLTVLAGIVSASAGGPALVATFNAALRCSRRRLAIVTALALTNAAVFPLLYPTDEHYLLELAFGELLTLLVIGWGLFARARREALLSLRERAERLEAEQHLQVELARTAERQRIAREMHDVLAHRISLLALHAGALELRQGASPDDTAAAAVIRESAHAALEELRDVIGLLREDKTNVGAPEPPQPTLAQIPELIEQSRAAGMRVRAAIAAPGAGISALLGRTAYRVVQEGLTNARKHAPGAAVDVTLTSGDRLMVEVVSRRPVGTGTVPGAGAGLIGLSERVALAGGRLEHGHDATGDFVLRATLPL